MIPLYLETRLLSIRIPKNLVTSTFFNMFIVNYYFKVWVLFITMLNFEYHDIGFIYIWR